MASRLVYRAILLTPPAASHPRHTELRWEQALNGRRCAILGRAENRAETLVYGLAHLGKGLFWYTSELLFAYFLTEIVGLSPPHMGAVIASGFVLSAAIDLLIGRGLAGYLASAASASRLQLVGAVICSISLIAVFVGAWLPAHCRFGYALATSITFRLGFATYDIPQNALMALATQDRPGRLRLASIRIWFSGAATLVVATTIGPLVAQRGAPDAVTFLLGLAALFALAAIGSAWLLARLWHHPPPPATPAAAPPVPPPTLPSATRGRLPPDFRLLLLVMVATSMFTPAFGKLEPYFAAYALRSAWWGGAVIMLMAVGIVVGQPLWLRLSARTPGGKVMLANALLQVVALTIFWSAGARCPATSAGAAFLFGLGNGGVGMVQWAAFSETVARLGRHRAGFSYGLFAATSKLSLAAGGLLLATALGGVAFRDGDSEALICLMAVLPGMGALCCVVAGFGLSIIERERGSGPINEATNS